jgi:transposase
LGTLVPRKDVHMPRSNPPYPPEFRVEAIRLARSGEIPLAQVARDLGIADQTLRNWIAQADVDEGRRDGLTSNEREERTILKEAAAFFAREIGPRK